MKKVKIGDEVELSIYRAGTGNQFTIVAKLTEYDQGGVFLMSPTINLDLNDGGLESLGLEIERPKKRIWVSKEHSCYSGERPTVTEEPPHPERWDCYVIED